MGAFLIFVSLHKTGSDPAYEPDKFGGVLEGDTGGGLAGTDGPEGAISRERS